MHIKHGLNTWAGMPVCDFEPYTLGDELAPAGKPVAVV